MKGPVDVLEREPKEVTNSQVNPSKDSRVDFSDYMWMGEELEEFDRQALEKKLEEFEKQVEEEFWEEEFIEACFEEMLEEEERAAKGWYLTEEESQILEAELQNVSLRADSQTIIMPTTESQLNPNAPEFIPRQQRNGQQT